MNTVLSFWVKLLKNKKGILKKYQILQLMNGMFLQHPSFHFNHPTDFSRWRNLKHFVFVFILFPTHYESIFYPLGSVFVTQLAQVTEVWKHKAGTTLLVLIGPDHERGVWMLYRDQSFASLNFHCVYTVRSEPAQTQTPAIVQRTMHHFISRQQNRFKVHKDGWVNATLSSLDLYLHRKCFQEFWNEPNPWNEPSVIIIIS